MVTPLTNVCHDRQRCPLIRFQIFKALVVNWISSRDQHKHCRFAKQNLSSVQSGVR